VRSRARVLGHPVHPVLVAFPLGLLLTALLFDLWGWWSANLFWSDLAFYVIVAGVIGGFLAAPFGLVDWLAIPRGTRAKAIGAWHGGGNVVALALFSLSAWLRLGQPAAVGGWPLLVAMLGAGVVLVTGWLGGELVVRLAIGVDPNAHVDAPSSLSQDHVPEAHSHPSHVGRPH
jgi:uncharacterized membrane protein